MKDFVTAEITELFDLSNNTRGLRLRVEDKSFTFEPGQWVDFTHDGVDSTGGYSMTTTPKFLAETGCFDLAVQKSLHRMATWIHDEAQVGDKVQVRVNGKVFYKPESMSRLVLIAGGIGSTPLWSIAKHVTDLEPKREVHFFYSAKTENDLLFLEDMQKLAAEHAKFKLHTAVTDIIEPKGDHARGRWSAARIRDKAGSLGSAVVYLCGPGAMIDNLSATLPIEGVQNEKLHFEKWH